MPHCSIVVILLKVLKSVVSPVNLFFLKVGFSIVLVLKILGISSWILESACQYLQITCWGLIETYFVTKNMSDSIFKSRDVTLSTKVHLVKAMVFPVVMYGCVRVGLWRRLSAEELMPLNCGVGEDSWESPSLQGDPTSPFWRRSALGFLWKEWC